MIATALEPEFVAEPGTTNWMEARSTGIGASECAAACGVGQYDTPLHVYLRKRGELPPIDETEDMWWGKELEPSVCRGFTRKTGIKVSQYPCPMLRHPDYPYMLATPDARLESDELLECKTRNIWTGKELGEEGTDQLPENVWMQAQQQLSVTGLEVCHVATLIDRRLKIHRVERSDSIIARIVELEGELWERIQTGNAPEPSWNHPATAELIKELNGVETGKTVILGNDIADIWREQKDIADRMKELKETRDSLRAKVAFAMGDAAIAMFEANNGVPCDFEVVRKQIDRKAYEVAATSYVDMRQRKA